MKQRFYLEVLEDGHRIPVGPPNGYETLTEAKEKAKEKVDDAMPRNVVRVTMVMAEAYLAGDGAVEIRTV